MAMIKCECQTWEGSEKCQKSKLAFLQVYVPMESLINILSLESLSFYDNQRERKEKSN